MAVTTAVRGLVAPLVFCTAACSFSPPGPIEIALVTDGTSSAIVRVTGLSTRELGALSGMAPDDVAWHDVLRVIVTGADVPIVGRYSVRPTSLEFRPMFPFDAGRSYSVRFDGGRLPEPRRPPITEVVLVVPAAPAAPPAAVTRIDPALDRWPENLLRFYIHFSAPMSRQSGVGLVHVLDERGQEVTDALLPVEVDFWNDDHTRLTVFFEPGRVKRGILPNRQMGRALDAGRRYTILVDAGWRDASGQALREPFRHAFTAAPPIEQPLATGTWRIQAPRAGTRDPLVVVVPHALDHALFERALGVTAAQGASIAGTVTVAGGDREWTFAPRDAWRAGRHEIIAAAVLEDPAGNRIGRAFEAQPGTSVQDEPDEYRVAFEIRP